MPNFLDTPETVFLSHRCEHQRCCYPEDFGGHRFKVTIGYRDYNIWAPYCSGERMAGLLQSVSKHFGRKLIHSRYASDLVQKWYAFHDKRPHLLLPLVPFAYNGYGSSQYYEFRMLAHVVHKQQGPRRPRPKCLQCEKRIPWCDVEKVRRKYIHRIWCPSVERRYRELRKESQLIEQFKKNLSFPIRGTVTEGQVPSIKFAVPLKLTLTDEQREESQWIKQAETQLRQVRRYLRTPQSALPTLTEQEESRLVGNLLKD